MCFLEMAFIRSKKTIGTNKSICRSFLGMSAYSAMFLPNLSSNTKLQRDLMRKDTDWQWTKEHDELFDFLIHQFSNADLWTILSQETELMQM